MRVKAKHSITAKATRFPIPLWLGWQDILQLQLSNSSNIDSSIPSKLPSIDSSIPSNSTLDPLELHFTSLDSILSHTITLISSQNNWQAQNSALSSITELIKPLYKASPQTTASFLACQKTHYKLTLLANIFVHAYFTTHDPIFRRSLLTLLSKFHSFLSCELSEILLYKTAAFIASSENETKVYESKNVFLDSTLFSWESLSYSSQNLYTKAFAVLNLLQMPISRSVLDSLDIQINNYFLQYLDSLLTKFSSADFLESPSVELINCFSVIHQLAKVILFIISKSGNYRFSNHNSNEISSTSSNKNIFISQLGSIFDLFKKFLFFDSSELGIEAREISALITVFCIKSMSDLNHSDPYNQFLLQLSTLLNSTMNSDDHTAKICLSRAIISNFDDHNLVCDPKYSSLSASILKSTFNQIADLCGKSHIPPSLKVVCFDSLNMWLQNTCKIISTSLSGLHNQTVPTFTNDLCIFIFKQNKEYLITLLWNYWDDIIEAVQHKVKSIFEALIDIAILFSTFLVDSEAHSTNLSKDFIDFLINQVVAMDWSQKVKYSLLASLIKRLGSNLILSKQSDLIYTALSHMENLMMAPRVAQLISSLLSDFKTNAEKKSTINPNSKYDYFSVWALPISRVLLSGNTNLVKMVSRHILPIALQTNNEMFFYLLKLISESLSNDASSSNVTKFANVHFVYNSEIYSDNFNTVFTFTQPSKELETIESENYTAAIISILFTAKSLGLIQPFTTIDGSLSYTSTSPTQLHDSLTTMISYFLIKAINHQNWDVRSDTLDLLCLSPRLLDSIHISEVSLFKKLLEKSANSPNPEFRQRQHSVLISWAERLLFVLLSCSRKIEKNIEYQKNKINDSDSESNLELLQLQDQVNMIKSIVNWWYELAIGCFYPGATFVRVATGIQWLSLVIKYFCSNSKIDLVSKNKLPECTHNPLENVLDISQLNSVQPIISVLINDTFKINRNSAFELLLKWPVLKTYSTVQNDNVLELNENLSINENISNNINYSALWINELVEIAFNKIFQTRSTENESGAYLLYFVFCKFVLNENSVILFDELLPNQNYSNPVISSLSKVYSVSKNYDTSLPHPVTVLIFISQLVYSLGNCLDLLRENLLDAALKKPVSGLLMAIKLIIEKIDFTSIQRQIKSKDTCLFISEIWKTMVNDLIITLDEMSSEIINVLSNPSPEGNIPASFKDTDTEKSDIIENNVIVDDFSTEFDDDFDSSESILQLDNVANVSKLAPKHQIILSFCWRSIKEISGLQTHIACFIPSTDTCKMPVNSDNNKGINLSKTKSLIDAYPIIDSQLVVNIGESLFALLTSMRHRGAFAAVYVEFAKICKRIYNSIDNNVNNYINTWLDKCLTCILSQQVSITRRSAGWPYCLLALITCDSNCIINNLPPTVKKLLEISNCEIKIDKNENNNVDLPQVHAINMIRILIDDKILHSYMIPYFESAMLLALNGLESNFWPIRNVCGLLFAVLINKLFGIKKSKTENAKVNGITARELFTKFPGLYSLLFNKIEISAKQLDQFYANTNQSQFNLEYLQNNTLGFVNPALYPCLTLLSRLQMPTSYELAPDTYQNPVDKTISSQLIIDDTNNDNKNLYNAESFNTSQHKDFDNNISLLSFTHLVICCSRSPVMKTRLMAAKAAVPTIPLESVAHLSIKLLQKATENLSLETKASESTYTTFNEIHGNLMIIYELLNAHIGESLSEYTIINIITPMVPYLKHLCNIALDDRTQNEIIRSSTIKILVLICGNITWFVDHFNILELGKNESISGIDTKKINLDTETSILKNKNDIKYFLESINKFQQFIWNDYCRNMLSNQINGYENDKSLMYLPTNRLVLGAPDTALELTKLTLKLLSFYLEYPKLWPSNQDIFSIKSIITMLLENTDFYEVHIFTIDWLDYFIPQYIANTNISSFSKIETLSALINKLLDLIFIMKNESLALHSDQIVTIKALNTISMLLASCYKARLSIDSIIYKHKIEPVWMFAIDFIKTSKMRISVKCSLLNFLSSLIIPIKSLNDDSNRNNKITTCNINNLIDIISDWSGENNTILNRQASCNSIENICLYSTNLDSSKDTKGVSLELISPKLIMALFDLFISEPNSVKSYSNDHAAQLLLSEFLSFQPKLGNDVSFELSKLLFQHVSIKNLNLLKLSQSSKSATLFEKEPNNVYKETVYIFELVFSLLEEFCNNCMLKVNIFETEVSLKNVQSYKNDAHYQVKIEEAIKKMHEFCNQAQKSTLLSSQYLESNKFIMNSFSNKREIDCAVNLIYTIKLGFISLKLSKKLDSLSSTLNISKENTDLSQLFKNVEDLYSLLDKPQNINSLKPSNNSIHPKIALLIGSIRKI
ncbi:hypothetical protein BB561_003801 [Smittium simulii]|uniref:Uncharacterized protein n=1 Tax=Smittium simulii TaxID=133385 RepID=A0A2T9YJI4_9FUNG|nr:hypothetical protein BB561_003801 [Smittium simulii]